jgi:hypothetical protein
LVTNICHTGNNPKRATPKLDNLIAYRRSTISQRLVILARSMQINIIDHHICTQVRQPQRICTPKATGCPSNKRDLTK